MDHTDTPNNQNNTNGSSGGYWQNMEPGSYYRQPYQQPKNGFATAAMILGICSLALLCTFFLPLLFGSLGLVFVILSKRRGQKLSTAAVAGLATSLGGAILGALFLIYVAVSSAFLLNPDNRGYLNQLYEQQYGVSFDDYIDAMEEQLGDDSISSYIDQLFQ